MHVIINGVSSETLQGVQVLSLPPITKPRMRTSVAVIDGRPGDIVTRLGYEAYNRKIRILLHHDYDIDAISAFFNTSGTIIFSNEPDMEYEFETIDAFSFERAVQYKTADITFHVQPYKLSATEQPATGEVSTLVDRTPYIIRRTPFGTRQKGTIVGGSIVWNQLCNNASVTVANGHKYLLEKDDAYSTGASTGTALTGLTAGSDMVFDLTLMFGTEIADYIYTREQATAGTGVAIKSVTGVTAHRMTGKNIFGGLPLAESVRDASNSSTIDTSAGFVTFDRRKGSETRVIYDEFEVGKRYTFFLTFRTRTSTMNNSMRVYYTDGSETIVRADSQEKTLFYFTTTAGKSVDKFVLSYYTVGAAELYYDESGIFEGVVARDAFEPYTTHTYPLDSSLTLRGLPKLDGDSLYYDGDVYKADGTVERRYGVRAYQSGDESDANVRTDGTNTVYKLTTPTTEQAEPYTFLQICDPAGTEEFVGASIPVGHDTTYIDPISMTVTNEGNTESAPSITIEGEGTVEVTADGLNILQIQMPASGEITIDSKTLDATDGEGGLANRSVTGDYNDLRLAPGEHTVTVTGDVTSVTLKNTSRWI